MRDADRRSAADSESQRASRLRETSQVEPPHNQLVAARNEAATLASRGLLRPAQRVRHAYTGRVARVRSR